jgi:VanZ family protein
VVTSLQRHTTRAMNEPLIRTIQIVAWAFFVIIVYATLTHVAFVYSIYHALGPWLLRPEIKAYARLEHVTAFAVLGAIFLLAYPGRAFLVCCLVFSAAITLEYLQTLTPDRHGTLIDAVEKLGGASLGILAARAFLYFSGKART